MTAAVIIPARYGSTRFPGKPLMRGPDGKPLIQYVWEAARRAPGVEEVAVATDDERIAAAVRGFGGEVRMTGAGHPSGSDRCAEAAEGMTYDVIVNLQGDEPSIPPEEIARAVQLLDEDGECVVGTLATPITGEAELLDPGVVKVVLDERGRALYFSRSVIPHVRGSEHPLKDSPLPFLRHLGIYAYRREFLREYTRLGPHALEEAEKLEQLRVLAHGYKIKVGLSGHRPMKVDTPEDFEAFRRWKSQT
jgi:3-deoxy-manno-octulosonate cytidylyltransferase (CMP-KDO synthetase)